MSTATATVDELLNQVQYEKDVEYVPSEFAIEFINFIKLVNGAEGEENSSPVTHYKMLEGVGSSKRYIANMLFRGASKTSLVEYLFLYIAVYGEIPNFGEVSLAIYVSDSIDNGVKNMRKNLEFRYENSDFLKQYIAKTKFTDTRWEFESREGHTFIVKGYGAITGVRGTKELGVRPQLAVLDDLLTDEGSRSKTVMQTVETTVYSAIDHALHPKKKKVIWNGTPFNKNDPLYKAIESGAWTVSVYPICNEFPCSREDFRGAWEDRFNYDYVKQQYDIAMATGNINSFNQELLLRVMSGENRLVNDEDIVWYQSSTVLAQPDAFNFYITSDFATTEKESGDFSVAMLWAYSNKGHWLLVDGMMAKQLMNKNIDWVFQQAGEYNEHLQEVGIEVNGQQGGFIPWIQQEMVNRNCYFNLASSNNSNKAGIRAMSNKSKHTRFMTVVPLFKAKRIWLPEDKKSSPLIQECLEELNYATLDGIKSRKDDCIDNFSMLSELTPWKPSQNLEMKQDSNGIWESDDEEDSDYLASYLV